jgi:UDPglucose 6-dehydrogenase
MQSRSVTVFGAGYVGLVTGACLASAGHDVTVVDIDDEKLDALRSARIPFHEPELASVVETAAEQGNLRFARPDELERLEGFVFVAVGTPSTLGGSADLRFVRTVIRQVGDSAAPGTIVVMKSTVPPGTGRQLDNALRPRRIGYVSNPEFLREGRAVSDWFQADRIVLGGEPADVESVASLYDNIETHFVLSDITSAELIKYASNAFLATKISFANEIANLCDCVGADVEVVMNGVGLDKRIGRTFLNAGIGYGGSCFPKDTRALDFLSSINGHDFHLLKAVIDVNARQRLLPIMAIRKRFVDLSGMRIAVLGLTFKPDTDDTREAPASDIVGMLLAEGAHVSAFDPVGRMEFDSDMYRQVDTLEDALDNHSAAIVTTEWDAIRGANWGALIESMAEPRFVYDGRNCLDGAALRARGAEYQGVGRP